LLIFFLAPSGIIAAPHKATAAAAMTRTKFFRMIFSPYEKVILPNTEPQPYRRSPKD